MRHDTAVLASIIRYLTLDELLHAGYGHFGGSLSIVEVLAVLYGTQMRYDPRRPRWDGRDYLVLSKGHAAPALYAALAATGFIPRERLSTLNCDGTDLPSHADRQKVDGVDMTTGSMGQGMSVASGIAYALKAAGKDNRVYCIVGDGELNEGQCWEAAQFIAHQRLVNLVILVDDNKRQLDGWTREISGEPNTAAKFTAFGFHASKVAGQDLTAISTALDEARARTERPTAIVLDTVKGAGVDYIASLEDNHHVRLDEHGKTAIREELESLAARLARQGVEL